MTDSHRVAKLIPWYVNGSLSAEERREVDEHLAGCDECRASVDEARELVDLGRLDDDALLDHVQAQHLERFAGDPESLEPALSEWIGRHVESCEACRCALDTLRRLDLRDELLREPTTDTGRVIAFEDRRRERKPAAASASSGFWELLGRTVLHPAAAAVYLIALVLSVPIYRALAPQPQTDLSPAQRWGGAVDLPVLSDVMRGETGAVEVVVAAGQPVVPLALEFDVPPELTGSMPIGFEITENGTVVWSHEMTAERVSRNLSDSGLVVLLIPASALKPGTHRTIVKPADAIEARPLLETPFEIVR